MDYAAPFSSVLPRRLSNPGNRIITSNAFQIVPLPPYTIKNMNMGPCNSQPLYGRWLVIAQWWPVCYHWAICCPLILRDLRLATTLVKSWFFSGRNGYLKKRFFLHICCWSSFVLNGLIPSPYGRNTANQIVKPLSGINSPVDQMSRNLVNF